MKYILVVTLTLGAVLLYMLAAASANTDWFDQRYPLLVALNTVLALSLMAAVGYQIFVLARQRRRKQFGSLLTFRLLAMFALVTVVPGALVYTVSVQFLGKSIESWFDVRVDRALEGGLRLGKVALDSMLLDMQVKVGLMASDLAEIPPEEHARVVGRMREQVEVDSAALVSAQGRLLVGATREGEAKPVPPSAVVLAQARANGRYAAVEARDKGLLLRVLVPIPVPDGQIGRAHV